MLDNGCSRLVHVGMVNYIFNNSKNEKKSGCKALVGSDDYDQEDENFDTNLYAVIAMIWACPKTMSAGGVKFAATISCWEVF